MTNVVWNLAPEDLKVRWIHSVFFVIFYKENNFCDFLFFPAHDVPSGMGSTRKGKNLHPLRAIVLLLE